MTNKVDLESSGAALSQHDWRFLKQCRDLLATDPTAEQVMALMGERSSGPWIGLIMDIRLDLQGLFGLFKSDCMALELRTDLASNSRDELRNVFIKRISAIKPGSFVLPPALYTCVRTALDLGDRRIPVRPVAEKCWDYIVLESLERRTDYYVEFLCGSIALYTKVAKLSCSDGAIVRTLTPPQLDRLVDSYR